MPRCPEIGAVLLVVAFTVACDFSTGKNAPLGPSPVIAPDSTTLSIGQAEVFRVMNATVASFDLSADKLAWSSCVSVDQSFSESNALRLVAIGQCGGPVYVRADIGADRSPLVALLRVR
jgi:hypothetical protein